MLRGSVAWVCRGVLVAVLLGAGASGPQASAAPQAQRCGAASCTRAGTIRWQETLPGAFVIPDDSRGTVPAAGEPYAAMGPQFAVFGLGTVVTAYDANRGSRRWTVRLKGLRRGAQIVSTRAWPGTITVGVALPAGRHERQATQTEVVLRASTGQVIRSYPSTSFGGAVAADGRNSVIVGPGAVTEYENSTGRVVWRRPTGAVPQHWELDGHFLYVTVASGGHLASWPVTALRKIDLHSGAERIIRPKSASFTGMLSAALDGVALFSGPAGVTAYSGTTGRWLWHVAGALPQGVDLLRRRFYLTEGSEVIGVGPYGGMESRLPGSAGLYGERGGVAFGLDEGANGQAWGVDESSKRVTWSTRRISWPHVFVDLGGLGGSADPRTDAIILAACAQVNRGVNPPRCTKPELVAINR